MSPEQRRGAEANPRSDLYAAAVVLFEMLTARAPWPRDVLLAGRRARGDFRLPEEVTHDHDPALVNALQAHLDDLGDPDSARRPTTKAALATAHELHDLAIAHAH
jgi:serine/threonine-protein kinase